MSDEVYRSVRMTPFEVNSLLKRLDSSARDGAEDAPRRAHARLEFRVSDVLVAIKHPGEESVSRYLVATRNLSAGGMSFMHGGFLHTGTLCSIVLTDTDGGSVKLLGVVRSCRHVAKTVHEIGVQFTKKIDPSRFVRSDARMVSNDPGLLNSKLPDLHGRALFVSEIECERSAAKARFSATGLDVDTAQSVDDAVEMLGAGSFDLVLLDSALGSSSASEGAERLREAGFARAVLCLVEERDAPGLAACDAISAIVRMPSPVATMMDIVAGVLSAGGDPASAGSVYSVFGHDRSMGAAIEHFVATAGAAAKDLTEAIAGERRARLREICATLKRGGWENGFPAFGEATRRVLVVLERGEESVPLLHTEVERLASLCTHIRAGSAESTRAGEGQRKAPGDAGKNDQDDSDHVAQAA